MSVSSVSLGRARPRALAALFLAIGLIASVAASPAEARPANPTTTRVNLPDPSTGNLQANFETDDVFEATMSARGRYVVFTSKASNLVAADTDTQSDLFLHDRRRGTTELVNVSTAGAKGIDDAPFALAITPDGRYVVFASEAANLVPGDTNGSYDVFVRDRQAGTTELISTEDPTLGPGPGGNGHSGFDFGGASISDDGRYVAFGSLADNLVPNDANGTGDIFLHDRTTGTTTLVSVADDGSQGDDGSFRPRLSGNGRYLVFTSRAGNLDPADDTPGQADVYFRDLLLGETQLVSVAADGTAGNGSSGWGWPSDDGSQVVFHSNASDLDPVADDNTERDIFVRYLSGGGLTELLVTEADGTAPDLGALLPSTSSNGRWVVFGSASDDLVPGDTNGIGDVFRLDTRTGTIIRVSVASNGAESNGWSNPVAISDNGRRIAFASYGSNLVPGDTNGVDDVFVHQLPRRWWFGS